MRIYQTTIYHLLTWIGHQIYKFRRQLEQLQHRIDKYAGRFWKEDY